MEKYPWLQQITGRSEPEIAYFLACFFHSIRSVGPPITHDTAFPTLFSNILTTIHFNHNDANNGRIVKSITRI